MNNRMLEDQQEKEHAARVAAALGISVDEIDRLDWSLDTNESDDGVLYGCKIYFGEDSDPEVLSKIVGLIDGRWISLGPVL